MKLDKYTAAELELIRCKANLTKDEAEVFLLRSKGKSNQEVADKLMLSVRTVERRNRAIRDKVGRL